MAVKYQDYYELLGVSRNATQAEVQSAYRKLARKFHPDVNKNADAEDTFKRINEAYEVLKDAAKRKKYDQLGMNWQTGDDFTPPPGWNFRGSGPPRGFNVDFGNGFEDSRTNGFSDFFESLFGGTANDGEERDGDSMFSGIFSSRPRVRRKKRGQDHEVELEISLEDAYSGGRKSVTLTTSGADAGGQPRGATRTYQVTIPPGVTEGKRLRLSGQGGTDGGTAGDLYFVVRIASHNRFTVDEKNIETTINVTPWEAALGSTINIPLVVGTAEIKLPAGFESDKRIRVKNKGLGNPKDGKGDLYARIRIRVPPHLTAEERKLFEKLSKVSKFDPRNHDSR